MSRQVKLTDLVQDSGIKPIEVLGQADISSVVMDSRKAAPGSLFVCMPSKNSDTLAYLESAAQNGAVAALVFDTRGVEIAAIHGMAALLCSNDGHAYNEAIWRLCRSFFDSPTREMKVIGVTGTNGKTTTAWLLRDMMQSLGIPTGYLGTLGFQLPGEDRELSNTTPFGVEVYSLMDEARERGVEAMAMEVSSHALEERRIDGTEFDAAVFTNLTQDHLDFHGTMAAYERSKWRLFDELPLQTEKPFVAAFNVDDLVGLDWSRQYTGPMVRYGFGAEADLVGTPHEVKVDRIRLGLTTDRAIEVEVPLGGGFNVSNCLSAAAGMLALGFDLDAIKESLPKVRPVPGRFEAVSNDLGIGILVDYAHTSDALEKLLDSVLALKPNRVITVFGCGGDRDNTKRPKMARAASERSDVTVVTSDNPRTEDPASILAMVEAGIIAGKESVSIIDRQEAVAYAIGQAKPGDVVVIAGKGHENYQIIGRTKHPMDDRELARAAFR